MELRHLGINMIFCPTVDVYISHGRCLGTAGFSRLTRCYLGVAVAYFRGMRDAGIICTAKHSPGTEADEDSHGTLAPRRRNR
jgi:beta-N-acetylhexosaminidase